MTTLVVEYDSDADGSTGTITGWRYETSDTYEPGDDELVDDNIDHRELRQKQVDLSVDPPALVDNPEFVPPEPLDRANVSTSSKDEYRQQRQTALDARDAGDRDAELDALRRMLDDMFEILTGEEP